MRCGSPRSSGIRSSSGRRTATPGAAQGPPTAPQATAVEYFNSAFGHYFVTAFPAEVAALAAALKVTRGGFYWHFKGRQDLLDALLDDWVRTNTAAFEDDIRVGHALSPHASFQRNDRPR